MQQLSLDKHAKFSSRFSLIQVFSILESIYKDSGACGSLTNSSSNITSCFQLLSFSNASVLNWRAVGFSPQKLSGVFLFPRWDMLVPWRVNIKSQRPTFVKVTQVRLNKRKAENCTLPQQRHIFFCNTPPVGTGRNLGERGKVLLKASPEGLFCSRKFL